MDDRRSSPTFSRRHLLGAAGSFGLCATTPTARAAAPQRRYLFVVAAMGGASIIDSFLPVLETESNAGANLGTYKAGQITQPPGSQLRCVLPTAQAGYGNGYSQATFLSRHKDDCAVMCVETASVNHDVAQRRSLDGGGVNAGRTIMEAVALRHGDGLVLANCNMAEGGYGYPGSDPALPAASRAVAVADPLFFAFGTHGSRGVAGAPGAAQITRARDARARLEAVSPFGKTFGNVPSVARYRRLDEQARSIERVDAVSRLMLLDHPRLRDHGLSSSPARAELREAFANLDNDPFEAQAALAYLLVREGLSCAVTISPSSSARVVNRDGMQKVENTQLAFDNSHTQHRLTQSVMWSRVLSTTDGLITLLKKTPDPAAPGRSLWASSLVYVATDFGRDKERPPGATEFGTGHHLNNGVLMISPLLKGNRVYGGVAPHSCLTHGFDPRTGAPAPGTTMSEGDVYSAIAHAMDVSFAGRRDIPAMLRA